MLTALRPTLLLALLALTTTSLRAQTTPSTPAPLTDRLNAWVNHFVENHRFNGAVLVLESGRPVLNRAVGQADVNNQTPVTTTSLFNLADASQAFTAVAVLQLKEQGKLSLDDELSKTIPELRNYSDVTLRHLLTHTSGVPSYEPTMAIHWTQTSPASNRDLVRVLAAHPPALEFRPGQRYQRSATNYALLATVVERVSGRDFAVYCLENIFSKAGMTRSFVYKPTSSAGGRALPYRSYLLKAATLDDQGNLGGIVGDKNVLSCTDDLIAWEAALANQTLLKSATLSEATVPATVSSGASTQHGFGWSLPTGLGRRVAELSGQLGGYGVVYTRLLDEQHSIVVLTNMGFAKNFALADGLYNILTGVASVEPRIPVGLLLAEVYRQQGLVAALNRYSAIRNNTAQRGLYDVRESELNVLGHELIEQGRVKDAIEVFKANADAYPRSFNVYDSLAEAYAADGQKDNAIANYKRSLLLYPENVNAQAQLRKLEGKK